MTETGCMKCGVVLTVNSWGSGQRRPLSRVQSLSCCPCPWILSRSQKRAGGVLAKIPRCDEKRSPGGLRHQSSFLQMLRDRWDWILDSRPYRWRRRQTPREASMES